MSRSPIATIGLDASVTPPGTVTGITAGTGITVTGGAPTPTVGVTPGAYVSPAAAVAGQILGSPSNGTAAFENALATVGQNIVTNPQFGAKCNGIWVTDGAMSAGSPNLTSSLFATATPGMVIRVAAAGNAGGSTDLITTILSVTDASHGVLSANCLKTGGVSGATVFAGTDDTAAIQSAINLGGVVKVPAGTMFVWSSVSPVVNNTWLDLTGAIGLQITATNEAPVSYVSGGSGDPATQIDKFTVLNGFCPGTGFEQSNQMMVQVENIHEITISGTIVTQNSASMLYLQDCQIERVLNCNYVTTRLTNGRNGINLGVAPTSGPLANSPSNIIAIGNYVNQVGSACLCITGGVNSNGSNTLPVNAHIFGNICTTTGFACIALESGGTGTGNFYVQWATIALNICVQTGTASTDYAIELTNDSSVGSADPLLFNYILIAFNLCSSAAYGILSQASNSLVIGNLVDLADQAGTGNGISVNSHPFGSNPVTGVVVSNNIVRMGTAGAYGIYMATTTASETSNNDVSYASGATGSSPGIIIANSATDTHSRNDFIRGAPNIAFEFNGVTDCTVQGLYVLNCCSNAGSSGLFIAGTNSGVIVIKGCHFYDNRGTPKMTTVINNSGTGGTVYRQGNTVIPTSTTQTSGATTALPSF